MRFRLLTLALALVMISPAFAYTVGDGVCDTGEGESYINSLDDCTVYLDSCQNLNQINFRYLLNQSISTTSSCFDVSADNILFDLNGHEITGDFGTTYGITVSSTEEVIITNGTLKNWQAGVLVNVGSKVIVNKVKVMNSTHAGITLYDTEDCTVEWSEVTGQSYGYSIWVSGGDNNTLKYNTISAENDGIVVHRSNNTNIIENTVEVGLGNDSISMEEGPSYNTTVKSNDLVGNINFESAIGWEKHYGIVSRNTVDGDIILSTYTYDIVGCCNSVTGSIYDYGTNNQVTTSYIAGDGVCDEDFGENPSNSPDCEAEDFVVDDGICSGVVDVIYEITDFNMTELGTYVTHTDPGISVTLDDAGGNLHVLVNRTAPYDPGNWWRGYHIAIAENWWNGEEWVNEIDMSGLNMVIYNITVHRMDWQYSSDEDLGYWTEHIIEYNPYIEGYSNETERWAIDDWVIPSQASQEGETYLAYYPLRKKCWRDIGGVGNFFFDVDSEECDSYLFQQIRHFGQGGGTYMLVGDATIHEFTINSIQFVRAEDKHTYPHCDVDLSLTNEVGDNVCSGDQFSYSLLDDFDDWAKYTYAGYDNYGYARNVTAGDVNITIVNTVPDGSGLKVRANLTTEEDARDTRTQVTINFDQEGHNLYPPTGLDSNVSYLEFDIYDLDEDGVRWFAIYARAFLQNFTNDAMGVINCWSEAYLSEGHIMMEFPSESCTLYWWENETEIYLDHMPTGNDIKWHQISFVFGHNPDWQTSEPFMDFTIDNLEFTRGENKLNSADCIYTIGDGVCSGSVGSLYYFDFNRTASDAGYIGTQGSPTYEEEVVDTTYNSMINDTAFHFSANGSAYDGVHPAFYLYVGDYNTDVTFDINTVKFDMFNLTTDGVYHVDSWVFMDVEGDKRYAFNFASNFPLGEEVDIAHFEMYLFRYDTSCRIDYDNGTEIEWYDECPVELNRIDWFLINTPWGGMQSQPLQIDYVIDNMIVSDEEHEYNSVDCMEGFIIGDGYCSGTKNSDYYFDFSVTQSYFGGDEHGTYIGEIVDTTYNPDVNETAYHVLASGTAGEGIQIVWNFHQLGLNKTVDFPINILTFDIFDAEIDVDYSDVHIYNEDYSENKQYDFILNPGFPLKIETDYKQLKYIWTGYCAVRDISTGDMLEEYENDCPYEINRMDIFLINLPYPDFQSDDWSIDFVMDNLIVRQEENEFISQDCAIETTIGEIHEGGMEFNNRWVKFNAVDVSPPSRDDRLMYIAKRYGDIGEMYPYLFTDESGRGIWGIVDYQFLLENNTLPDYYGRLLEIQCYVNTFDTIPNWYICHNFDTGVTDISDLIVADLGDAPTSYYNPIELPEGIQVEFIGDSYVLTYVDVTDVLYYLKYTENGTHVLIEDLITNTTFALVEMEYAHLNSNQFEEHYRLYLDTDKPKSNNGYSLVVLSNQPVPEAYLNPPYRLINRGLGWHYEYGGGIISDGAWGMDWCGLEEDSPYSITNVVGDGLCGSLESPDPGAWNYAPECLFGPVYNYIEEFVISVLDGIELGITNVLSLIGLPTDAPSMDTTLFAGQQAIFEGLQEVDNKTLAVYDLVDIVNTKIDTLASDVADIKTDTEAILTDTGEILTDLSDVKADTEAIHSNMLPSGGEYIWIFRKGGMRNFWRTQNLEQVDFIEYENMTVPDNTTWYIVQMEWLHEGEGTGIWYLEADGQRLTERMSTVISEEMHSANLVKPIELNSGTVLRLYWRNRNGVGRLGGTILVYEVQTS